MKSTKKKNPRGRPSAYRSDYAEQARKLCEVFPATNQHLAKFFKVSTVTICEWKNKHPEFLNAVGAGKENRDMHVENALYLKAISGDVSACMFWLKNRQPDKWRDRREFSGTIKTDDGPDEFAQASDAELRSIIGTHGLSLIRRQGRETAPRGNGRGNGQ